MHSVKSQGPEPLILHHPAARQDTEFQPELFQKNIIDVDNEARDEEATTSRSDWSDRYADQ